jgi:hypothetical protein
MFNDLKGNQHVYGVSLDVLQLARVVDKASKSTVDPSNGLYPLSRDIHSRDDLVLEEPSSIKGKENAAIPTTNI